MRIDNENKLIQYIMIPPALAFDNLRSFLVFLCQYAILAAVSYQHEITACIDIDLNLSINLTCL